MSTVRGIHIIEKGNRTEAQRVVPDIEGNNRLLIGTGSLYGIGAYAWHEDRLPRYLKDRPQVLFEVDSDEIVDVHRRDGTTTGIFRILGDIGDYVSVRVISFANLH